MDQELLRQAYQEFNECCCAYEQAILARYCDCSRAERFCIGEREGISCNFDPAQAQCLAFLDLLRHHARFTLKNVLGKTVMLHTNELKIQVGGMRGLRNILDPQQLATTSLIQDVYGLLEASKLKFDSLGDLPVMQLIQQIAAFKGRVRRHRRT